jgi:antitoxin component of MazEF toxin-antitoxin module
MVKVMIMAVEVVLRRWGNSIGGVFPKSFVEEQGLKPNETILVDVVKKADLTPIFGSFKFKRSAQEMKDEAKKGWD